LIIAIGHIITEMNNVLGITVGAVHEEAANIRWLGCIKAIFLCGVKFVIN